MTFLRCELVDVLIFPTRHCTACSFARSGGSHLMNPLLLTIFTVSAPNWTTQHLSSLWILATHSTRRALTFAQRPANGLLIKVVSKAECLNTVVLSEIPSHPGTRLSSTKIYLGITPPISAVLSSISLMPYRIVLKVRHLLSLLGFRRPESNTQTIMPQLSSSRSLGCAERTRRNQT